MLVNNISIRYKCKQIIPLFVYIGVLFAYIYTVYIGVLFVYIYTVYIGVLFTYIYLCHIHRGIISLQLFIQYRYIICFHLYRIHIGVSFAYICLPYSWIIACFEFLHVFVIYSLFFGRNKNAIKVIKYFDFEFLPVLLFTFYINRNNKDT